MSVPFHQAGQQQRPGTGLARNAGGRDAGHHVHLGAGGRRQVGPDAFDAPVGNQHVDRRAIGQSNVV